ncbi:hypothetical protein CC86DRAFT_455222 [Ophiobolus disseminans]|uniref:LysR family regulatory protein n=1 Tax=Ophiobolus disseminans TaxID=1469910 RepID=A0A6A7A2S6_9PLEO|nr:hypothetical protein CC86DRAFT_455222 [Ophiobolus disseminans]
MAFLSNLFGKPPVAPERIPTDIVIPVFEQDAQFQFHSISLEITMRFDSVLDADKLHAALWKLLERPGWRKLGARLRKNTLGRLEYHIPARYTKDRPPVNFSYTTEALKISEHPVGARLPRPTGKLEVFGEAGNFRILTPEQSNTTLLEHWTLSDRPALGLHISTFEDATLVTIVWLHTVMDALALRELLRAWQAVLDGREEHVPDYIGYDSNPLAELVEPHDTKITKQIEQERNKKSELQQSEEYIVAPKLLSHISFARFIFRYIWELIWYPAEEGRMLFIPSSYFSRIKSSAFADLASLPKEEITYNNSTSKPTPFLSDGDILTAWTMRLLASTNPQIANSHPSRTIALMNVFGMRDLLRSTAPQLLPQRGAYVHNCVTTIWSHFSVQGFLEMPLGHVAARIRADLVVQSTRAQVEAGQRILYANKGSALYGKGDMALTTMTNWDKAKLYETDFSAAIVRGKSGKPDYLHVYATSARGVAVRGSANIVGKDGAGNWWVSSVFRTGSISAFVRAVEGMA